MLAVKLMPPEALMIRHIFAATTPEDLGHLLGRPALPVLTVRSTVPGTPRVRGAPQ
jgi:hypothetical protein